MNRMATAPIVTPNYRSMEQVLLALRLAPEHAAPFRNVTLPFELRPHQLTSLQGSLAWERHGLYDEPRTGKTIVMMLASIWFKHWGLRSIFVMPPSLFDQFLGEFDRIENHGMNVATLDQSPKKRSDLLRDVRTGEQAIDALSMSKEIFKKHMGELMKLGFKVLFFDECHMGLQSEELRTKKKAKTTYACTLEFADQPGNRVVLSTGTPIYNELYGSYPMITIKTPEAYLSRREFDALHVGYKRIKVKGSELAGGGVGRDRIIRLVDRDQYKRLNLLSENIFKHSTRALKLDVLDTSAPNIQIMDITLHKPHMVLYRKLMKERVLELEDELIDARQQAKLRAVALQLLIDPNSVSDTPIKNAVMDMIQTLLDSIDVKHNKVLLFANFINSVETSARHFRGYNPAIIYGPNGPTTNRANIKKFREDKTCRLAFANPKAGGVGLTFGDVAQTVILVEPISVPGEFDQAVSRVILSGQGVPVVVYILRVNHTISPVAIESLISKGELSRMVTKDRKTVLDELFGIM